MKRFIILIGFTMFMSESAFAADTFNPGVNDECWLEETGNDEYWFCGKQGTSCHGVVADGDDVKHWLYRRGLGTDTFTHKDRSFVCCAGSGDGEGVFVEYTGTTYETESIKYLNAEKTESCVMHRGSLRRTSTSSGPKFSTRDSVIKVPSTIMRSASQRGTVPVWRGKSACPLFRIEGIFLFYFIIFCSSFKTSSCKTLSIYYKIEL